MLQAQSTAECDVSDACERFDFSSALHCNYSTPVRKQSVMSVSVCPQECLWNYMPSFHQIAVHVTYCWGSVFIWRQCDALYILGFVDNVVFAQNGQE